MAEFKLVLSDPKSGKSLQREVKDEAAKALIGKKIGDSFKGESIDLPGYEFVLTGGSDASGFPMRWDVAGTSRKMITTVKGVGVKNKLRKPNPKKKGWRTINGMKLKRSVAGNTVYDKTAQINLKVTKIGRENLFAEAKPEGEAAEAAPEAKAETPAEKPKAEEKKEKPKPEEKPAPAEQKPSEDLEKIDKELKRDEEEIKQENEEIEKLEKELNEPETEEKKE